MEEITKWYADKIGKTSDEFDAIDKHIETVIQTWEKERNQALTIPVLIKCSVCGTSDNLTIETKGYWCNNCDSWVQTE